MKNLLILFLCIPLFSLKVFSQTLPSSRGVNWTSAGLQTIPSGFLEIDMQANGVIGDGTTSNDIAVSNVLASNLGSSIILVFPSGDFLFNNTINLPSNTIIRGQGVNNTTFSMNLNGSGHAINIGGTIINSITSPLSQSAIKNNSNIDVVDASIFNIGDWIHITLDDSNLVTSSWAENTVGQIVKIKNIIGNNIELESPLRLSLDLLNNPYIKKIEPVKNVGIECIKINRIDNTAPQQSSNIRFNYAVNCWVSGIESNNCTFSHIEARYSSNLYITKSYLHHAFDYGGGGRAYGVMLQFTTNECLVENNVFEHLRHSMILQAGANGNVFAYNYSFDPFWSSIPNDSAGDMVLHGNYVYSNLFEQNIGQNIVIDNSHGPNGPHNTFLRNRAEKFGIFFSASNSPNQNFLGNEITNTSFPYSLVNYTIQGTGHFIHGNNNKGTIDPSGTEVLPDLSYAYSSQPDFVPSTQWAKIGTQNILGSASIPAKDRYTSNTIFTESCDGFTLGTAVSFDESKFLLFPNPLKDEFTIKSHKHIQNITITNKLGQIIYTNENIDLLHKIDTEYWESDLYFVIIKYSNNKFVAKKIIKE